ncbi:uncharacterized protein LOC124458434 isoform X2 [Xenia sp. Carnegie-2017]|uniref:uncharacterized protein LOC124458434 isoform X2 n=1 Tax=Xenia sp. Carnegie-2017 TaxID=2897299 RepID=UPI001F03718D|nr:uncharacterized protein LOC124458434 isoform X2 [Xenia sp. Carnegie-2017]
MWEDERQRRRDIGLPSQVALTVSQDRVETPVLNLEKEFNEKIKEIIDERNKVIQSELETIEKSLSPKDFKEFSQSILSQGKQPQCEATINQDVDVDSPVVDQSVIDVLQASQASNSSGELDIELVEILMSLDKDDNETLLHECSLIAGSQSSDDEHDEDIDEDKESILMSQPFWKDNEEQHDSQRLMQTSETLVRTFEPLTCLCTDQLSSSPKVRRMKRKWTGNHLCVCLKWMVLVMTRTLQAMVARVQLYHVVLRIKLENENRV